MNGGSLANLAVSLGIGGTSLYFFLVGLSMIGLGFFVFFVFFEILFNKQG